MLHRTRTAFTIVELLVVVSIIALLIGILLPAIGKARDQARLTISQTNLRQLGQAHAVYASEWNGRQFTMIIDELGRYGSNVTLAMDNFHATSGGCPGPNGPGCHPGVILGWGVTEANYNSEGGLIGYWMNLQGNYGMVVPMGFSTGAGFYQAFGSFRIPNARQFSRYLNGRFYDPVFYAPKDRVVFATVEECFDEPGEFSVGCHSYSPTATPYWSSYCMSPAAMYNPGVFRNPEDGGFQDPFSLNAGTRSPALSQARYPELKTHMLEHHWLQQTRTECNPGFDGGLYGNCEPYYFNLGFESVPMTVFFDGHVEGLGVREARAADNKHVAQAGYGLWSRETPFGENGYFMDLAYDVPSGPGNGTSFHILTTDGILGRDKLK